MQLQQPNNLGEIEPFRAVTGDQPLSLVASMDSHITSVPLEKRLCNY